MDSGGIGVHVLLFSLHHPNTKLHLSTFLSAKLTSPRRDLKSRLTRTAEKFSRFKPTFRNFYLLPRPLTCSSDNQQRYSRAGHRLDSSGFFHRPSAQPFIHLRRFKVASQRTDCAHLIPLASDVKATCRWKEKKKKKKQVGLSLYEVFINAPKQVLSFYDN